MTVDDVGVGWGDATASGATTACCPGFENVFPGAVSIQGKSGHFIYDEGRGELAASSSFDRIDLSDEVFGMNDHTFAGDDSAAWLHDAGAKLVEGDPGGADFYSVAGVGATIVAIVDNLFIAP